MGFDAIHWALGRGMHAGQPLVVRFRQFPPAFPKAAFPERLNIFWEMRRPDLSGMPSDMDNHELNVFEERLVAAVECDGAAVLSVVLTAAGKREFVFHTADVEQFLDRLTAMPQERLRYPIEIEHYNDVDWFYDESVVPRV
jgi:hypothetical protein